MIADDLSGATGNPKRLRSGREGPAGATIEKVSAGKIPDSDELSLTVCPVHALSMESLNPREWVEMAWAARNAMQQDMNLERRGWFEGVKCLLLERDLPPSRVFAQPSFHGFKG